MDNSRPEGRRHQLRCCYGFSNETWNMTLYWWMQYFWITKATFSGVAEGKDKACSKMHNHHDKQHLRPKLRKHLNYQHTKL
uniref:Uncharacterized protein n=1 Tax=Timema shepardi TaxID=629360 RepID=A0A7R9AYE2_TIMSH|nr:unnamed protein product [Timema shepardi]